MQESPLLGTSLDFYISLPFYQDLHHKTAYQYQRYPSSMDSQAVTEILKVAQEIETKGFSKVTRLIQDPFILGTMFHNADSREAQVCQLTAARLGVSVVDLSWRDVDAKDTSALLSELEMANSSVDLMLTAFSSAETFGEGRKLTTKFSSAANGPIVSLHDDIYNWQTALSHVLGFQNRIGDLSGKKIVVSWGFGSNFANPSVAHGLTVSSALAGADVRVVAPPDFPTMNRVRKEAAESSGSFEETSDFQNAFADADAVYMLNWFRLDDFNHPERNVNYVSKYTDWYLSENLLPESCILSTDPTIQSGLTVSPELLKDQRCINSSWQTRRVQTLAATIFHALRIESSIT
jgi:ornithine carbamoyltransferase